GLKRLIDRLTVLIDSLLDLSRMQRGQLMLAREQIDLVGVTQAGVARLGEQEQLTTPVTVEFNGPAVGRWDRLRMEQVVTNLITNALKDRGGQPARVVGAASETL